MIVGLFFVAILIMVIFTILFALDSKKSKKSFSTYRKTYLKLIYNLEKTTKLVTSLGDYSNRISQEKTLSGFEITLLKFEALLIAIKKIPPYGNNTFILDSAHYLTQECTSDIVKFKKQLKRDLQSYPSTHNMFVMETSGLQIDAHKIKCCYFCSVPSFKRPLTKAKVSLKNKVKRVFCCKTCSEYLIKNNTAKILSFTQNKIVKHWSEYSDFKSNSKYWEINNPNKRADFSKGLKLVQLDRQRVDKDDLKV